MGRLKTSIAALSAASMLTGAAIAPAPALAKDIVINMAAPDWLPTRFMQEEFDKTYKSKSGNNVKLVIDFIPWGSFYQRVAASLSSGEKKYQMIVTDSQWLGDFEELPDAPSRPAAAAALDGAIAAVKARGKSDVGQKTMLDVLAPAFKAFAVGGDAGSVREAALLAAERTIPMRATRGRASFLGERSVGHVDPGARSASLMIGAVCDEFEGQ